MNNKSTKSNDKIIGFSKGLEPCKSKDCHGKPTQTVTILAEGKIIHNCLSCGREKPEPGEIIEKLGQ